MNIRNFLTSLLPIFGRSHVEIDIRQQQDIRKKLLLPQLKKLDTVLKGAPFTSDLAKPVEAAIQRLHGSRMNMVSILLAIYEALGSKLDYLSKVVDEEFDKDISRDDMTYKQVQIVRYLELSRFSMEYTMRLLNRFLAAEARTRLNQLERIDEQLTPAEIRWMSDNLETYMQVLSLLLVPQIKLRQAIENMPELLVKAEDGGAGQGLAGHNADPLKMNFINSSALNWNPIYHIRLYIAEMEVEHYQLLEKEILTLELRILELVAAKEERQDARLEQQIERREAQLAAARVKYHQQTEKYGLAA
ncbi:hypothetical protein [Stenotrophomonas sp. GD03657]|uniref:hypothetical protein n=1 Tax=Stenotrophomonas sp. GD03657 TaxID=2975363 RepID=UPI00244A0544|nr:hypothetical protein [Stenotrophomonas sp. GD03657]MDH2154360.1 hypothetical protein [Stenotrophomonas sp. GD03657]